jgi:hypothetical protein
VAILFGRHIVRRADAGFGEIDLSFEDFGDAEVSEFDPEIGDEDIGCFEVPMQDAFVVHVEDGEGYLGGPVDDLRLFEFGACMADLLLFNELVEVSSGAELHDDVELLAVDDAFAVGNDVDVLEGLQQLHLIEDVFSLLGALVRQLHLLDHVVLVL